MWLEHGHEAARHAHPCRDQVRSDSCWVVCVIVDEPDAVLLGDRLEAPTGTLERRQAPCGRLAVNAERVGNCQCRDSVRGVVAASQARL